MPLRIWRRRPPQQRLLPFAERTLRRQRAFKVFIVFATGCACIGLVLSQPRGRYLLASTARRLRWQAVQPLGLEPTRQEIDAQWRAQRQLDILETRRRFEHVYAKVDPKMRQILQAAGMTPKDALLRWGNYNRTLLLSSRVFAPDDTGRSYRLRPNQRSFWLHRITLAEGLGGLFLVPDSAEMQAVLADSQAIIVPGSVQTTNSWGCRGPEPDLAAPVRGIVLGDSFMQGLFIGDDDTPPVCLERFLSDAWHRPVSILNTGHLGYSPEQYYHSLRAYGERLNPHFVVVNLFANDFGETFEVLHGKGDWKEAAYWLGQIQRYCDIRQIPCVFTPAPIEIQVMGRRDDSNYQCQLARIVPYSSLHYVDPLEDFVNEHLRLTRAKARAGARPYQSPLYNGQLTDGHFSPEGSEVWGRALGRRIELLIDPDHLREPRKITGIGQG